MMCLGCRCRPCCHRTTGPRSISSTSCVGAGWVCLRTCTSVRGRTCNRVSHLQQPLWGPLWELLWEPRQEPWQEPWQHPLQHPLWEPVFLGPISCDLAVQAERTKNLNARPTHNRRRNDGKPATRTSKAPGNALLYRYVSHRNETDAIQKHLALMLKSKLLFTSKTRSRLIYLRVF